MPGWKSRGPASACTFCAPSTFIFIAAVSVYVPAETSWTAPLPSRTVKASVEPSVSFPVPLERRTRTLPAAVPRSVPGK